MASSASSFRLVTTRRFSVIERVAATSRARLIDMDANLLDDNLFADLDQHRRLCFAAGISHLVVPGCSALASEQALSLAHKLRDTSTDAAAIVATAGVHPYSVRATPHELRSDMEVVSRLVQLPHCACVGECGLDYSDHFPDKALQIPYFRAQLQIALDHRKPLFLHERLAFSDFTSLLGEFGLCTPQQGECSRGQALAERKR
jgi:TatD DNase family protein